MGKKRAGRYRKNVGMVLLREDGRILIAERLQGPSAWQFPQGGVDKGESLEEAMWRELSEELGLIPPQETCAILGVGPEVRYDFPPDLNTPIARKYAGQAQTLFVLRFNGADADIDLEAYSEPEFRAVEWVSAEEALRRCWHIKRGVLERTLEALPDVFEASWEVAP